VDAQPTEVAAVPVAPITATEALTRYITDQDYLASNPQAWRAFRPKPSENELSIARIEELSSPDIWQLGDSLAGKPSNRTVYGRADFRLPDVRGVKVNGQRLDAVPDDPPERHALIVDWPTDPNARKTAAMQLLAASVRHSVPLPVPSPSGSQV
jgi:hypothetical protein